MESMDLLTTNKELEVRKYRPSFPY